MDKAIARLRAAHLKGQVVGLKEVSDAQGGPKPRLDIDDLMMNMPDTFNLYLLAYIAIKAEDPSHIHSFYQLAGIHGLPADTWNNISPPAVTPDQLVGYCTHSDALFPSWHRVYLALFEQTLFVKMLDIAEEFPDSSREKYRNAARLFRLPYWDYFRPRGRDCKFPTIRDEATDGKPHFDFDFSVPMSITVEKIMVRTPENNELVMVDNPLIGSKLPLEPHPAAIKSTDWAHVLGEVESTVYSKEETARHPTRENPKGDRDRLNKTLNMRREDMMRYVLNIVLSDIYKSITSFATDATWDDMTSGSLEAYHNDYHVLTGGIGGHMGSVPIAAFDPIFWLHHASVDRYFAIWQAIHPTTWFSNPQLPGEQDKETKGLTPFMTIKGGSVDGFWTAADAREPSALGHIYVDANYPRDKSGADRARENFKRQYEWSRRLSGQNYSKNPWQIFDVSKAPFFQYGASPGATYYLKQLPNMVGTEPDYPRRTDEAKFSREWYIDNMVSRLALNGAFTIFWFVERDFTRINKTPPRDYVTLSSVAGMSHVFAAPVDLCDNCGEQESEALVVRNTKPITAILLDYVEIGELGSLEPEHVVPFLQKNLTWRIVTVQGKLINPHEVENFAVSITVKATPLPISANLEPLYLAFPQITQEIESREAIANATASMQAELEAKIAALKGNKDWAGVGHKKEKKKKNTDVTANLGSAHSAKRAGAEAIAKMTGETLPPDVVPPPAGGVAASMGPTTTLAIRDDRLAAIVKDNLDRAIAGIVSSAVAQYKAETGA